MSRVSRTIALPVVVSFVSLCGVALTPAAAFGQSTVDPKGGTATAEPQTTGNQVAFLVDNSKGDFGESLNFFCSVTGAVTSCEPSPTWAFLPAGESVNVVVTYSTGAPGTGTVTLQASGEWGDEGWYDVTVGTPEPDVTPDGDTLRTGADGAVKSAWFDVTNGDFGDTYNLSCSASAPLTCVNVTPSIVTLSPHEAREVQADYRANGLGTGRLTLNAASANASDSGYVHVNALDPATLVAPSVVDVSENNGFNHAKEKCLTFAVGQGLVQCGDLVLTHSLPVFRTVNRDRAPMLIYNSGTAEVRPTVHSQVTFPASGSLPDYFSVALFLDGQGTPAREAFYSTVGFNESLDETRRMSVVADGSALSTGVHSYVLEARAWYSYNSYERTASGELIVVNRRSSPYGAGWWLGGLERLYVQANGDALVAMGDGSAKLFTNSGGTYSAPAGEYSRLESNAGEGGWDRILRGGGRVHFDAAGRHVYTDDAAGNRTRFFYNSGFEAVDSVRIEATLVKWAFYYGMDAVLDSIVDPAGRTTTVTTSSGRITRLYHPDGAYRRFEYSSGSYVPYDLCDERGNCYRVTYDVTLQPWQVRNPSLPGLGYAYTHIRSAGVQGVDTLNFEPAEASTAMKLEQIADTLVDPRGNKTVFRTNIFGEPTYVRDALGQETWIARNSSSEPYRVQFPNGRVLRLTWDDGRPTELWDSTYAGDHNLAGEARVNFYYEDPSCPYNLTRMVRPATSTGTLTSLYTFDPPAGNFRGCRLKTVTDERGHVSEFTYLADGRLQRVTEKNVPAGTSGAMRDMRTTLSYYSTAHATRGFRGNLYQVTTLHPSYVQAESYPSATDTLVVTTLAYDAYGNLQQRTDPEGHWVQQWFNSRNLLTKVIVQKDPNDSNYDIIYEFDYDSAGNRTDVYTPYSSKDPPAGTRRSFTYNAWNLLRAEYAETPADSTAYVYDAAGNLSSRRNANGYITNFEYDPLNRVIQQAVPAATQAGFGAIPNKTIPADTVRWVYNEGGQIDTVRTRTDYVARSYFLDGTPATETQTIGGTVYTLAFKIDLGGRRTRLDHPTNFDSIFGDATTAYAYDGTDLVEITNPIDDTTRFEWDGMGRLTHMVQGNGVETRRFYNDAGALDSALVTSPNYYLLYSSSDPDWGHVDTLIYATRTRYYADGLIGREYESHDARVYRNDISYDAAHQLELAAKHFERCQYYAGPYPTQYCGVDFHPALSTLVVQDPVYDARGNVIEDYSKTEFLHRSLGAYFPDPDNPREIIYWPEFNDRNQEIYRQLQFASNGSGWVQILGQEFDGSGNLRWKVEEPEGQGGMFPLDSMAHYYTGDDRLAKTIIHYGTDRWYACVGWAEIDYEYDGFGRRIRKHVEITGWLEDSACDEVKDKAIDHTYIYDGDDVLYERIAEEWGSQNPIKPGASRVIEVMYTRGPSGEALSRYVPGTIAARVVDGDTIFFKSVYYHLDRQNTPVAATEVTGERHVQPYIQVLDYQYETVMGGSWSPFVFWYRIYSMAWRGVLEGDQMVGYVGQPYDPETGLHYFRNRYYDGRTGRFTQEDPIGLAGGMNLYAYAGNNPVNFTDPFGLCPICAAAYAVFEIGSSAYDLYDLGKTGLGYLRGEASGGELGITAAGVGIGLFAFGGGYGRAAREFLESGVGRDIVKQVTRFSKRKLGKQLDEYSNLRKTYLEHLSKYGQEAGKTTGEVNRIERQLEAYRDLLEKRGVKFGPEGEFLER